MSEGSIVVRRSIGRQLKAMRLAAGKTYADVGAAGICQKAKLARIEAGSIRVKVPDVRSLCWLYGADQATTDVLAELALNAVDEGWWEDYGDVMPQWFNLYVELEAAAARVLVFEEALIPGLLQTPSYHRAVFDAQPDLPPETADREVRARQDRQRAVFERTPPLQVTAVLSEAAVARQVGGRAVMDEQLAHLRSTAAEPRIEVRIVPWEAGAHSSMKGGFSLLEFANDASPEVVYLETAAGGRYIEKESIVDFYRQSFKLAYDQSVAIKEYQR
jgi:transcriptional regulator with XRE-family HTH domain